MALSGSGVFEVRPDGSAAQAGFFNAALGGSDYSQQTAAQSTSNDGVTNGTTLVTSAAALFVATMVGNGIAIQGDSWYEIRAVNSATSVTVDRNTGSGSGQTLRVGGATLIGGSGFSPVFQAVVVAGHKLWLRGTNAAGVATAYAAVGGTFATTGGTVSNPVTYEGYGTVRGDGGLAHIQNPSVNALTLASYSILKNVWLDGNGGGWQGAMIVASGNQCYVEKVQISQKAGTAAITNTGSGNVFKNVLVDAAGSGQSCLAAGGQQAAYWFCEFKNAGAGSLGATWLQGANQYFHGCLWNNNSGACVRDNNAAASGFFRHCIFWGTTFDSNTHPGNGIEITGITGLTAIVVQSCIFGNNAASDISHSISDASTNPGAAEFMKAAWTCNWFFTTGTGRYFQLPANPNDTTLAVNPFTASAAGDFSLNGATLGGALISTSPCTTSFVDGLNSASILPGFYGTVPAGSAVASMRTLWRELTNEHSSVVIPDAVVDLYLDGGLQALNRRVHYHYTDTTSAVTLVAGQQEYALPADCVWVAWIQWGGKELQKSDMDEWRRRDVDFKNEKAGAPREWCHYRDKLLVYPTPDAAAVAASAAPLIRYVSAPPSISTAGPEQLNNQDLRIPVYFGVAEFASAHPDSALATMRSEKFFARFGEEAQTIAQDYAMRLVGR